MSIQVSCQVREYPDKDIPYQTLIVRNHWNYDDRVVFELEGKTYIFLAKDLFKAITNATNHRSF